MTVPPPPNPRALLRNAGLTPKKQWGQNFLCDQNVLASIADATDPPEEGASEGTVVELGAGLGALTYHLVQRWPRVVAVERDRELIPLLREALDWADGLEVLEADAAAVSYETLSGGGALTVAGNLPYQLSSRILGELADAHRYVDHAVLLVQREVAQRCSAPPGSKTYGLLSVLVQRAFHVRLERTVSPGAFLPPPKVHSSVLVLSRHGEPSAEHPHLVPAARAAFSQRRKTIRNAIRGALGIEDTDALVVAIERAGLSPTARAETLGLEDFSRLGDALAGGGWL